MNRNIKRTIAGCAIAVAAAGIVLYTSLNSSASPTPTTATADTVAAKFYTTGLPVLSTMTYTAADDPNHLLGRPGGYTSKTSFTDGRINQDNGTPGSVDLGGSVEVYTSHADAQARADYITKIEKAMPALGTEYDYVNGTMFLRVSSRLTPDQAAAYENAAK